VFTARYGLSSYITQIRFVFKGFSVRFKANFRSANLMQGMYNIKPEWRLGLVFFCSRWLPVDDTPVQKLVAGLYLLRIVFVGSWTIIILTAISLYLKQPADEQVRSRQPEESKLTLDGS
jgi:hypothetical protein